MILTTSCTDFKEIICIFESMSVTSGDMQLKGYINTEGISNNDLLAHRLSGRLDLDLICASKIVAFSHISIH